MSCRFALAATLFAASAGGFASTCSAAQLGDVEHIIVIYLENHSFDNLFGFFPNADGIAAAGATKIQVDADGKPYSSSAAGETKGGTISRRFPLSEGPAEPTLQHRRLRSDRRSDRRPDPSLFPPAGADRRRAHGQVRRLHQHGRSGRWAFTTGAKPSSGNTRKRYTLADHFFHAAFGGSFLNHFWLICACTPVYKDAPASLKAASLTAALRRRHQPRSSSSSDPTRLRSTATP